MATTRLTVRNFHQENTDVVAGKAAIGKSMVTRSALSTISNTAQVQPRKGLKEQTNKPSRVPLGKAKTAAARKKENGKKAEIKPKVQQERRKSPSPAPMDISGNADAHCIAFSSLQISVAEPEIPANVVNIDLEDVDNPQLVSDYVNGIYDYMRELEQRFPVNEQFLHGYDVSGKMRSILIDWLVQVHMRFHLLQETLYLTVAILDRFLQKQAVDRKKLQLVGVTSMLIASKYEEMYAPEIGDFEYITDHAYTNVEIRRMECLILKTLNFNLGRPLPLHFLRRNSKAGEVDAAKHTMAKYFMELSLVDYDLATCMPSEIAAAALCLSMKVFEGGEWNETLQFYSKYSEEDLLPVMRRMAYAAAKKDSGKLKAIFAKYKGDKFMRVSICPELSSPVIIDLAAEAIN